jgi:AhpD family alkylhydroperoxidase
MRRGTRSTRRRRSRTLGDARAGRAESDRQLLVDQAFVGQAYGAARDAQLRREVAPRGEFRIGGNFSRLDGFAQALVDLVASEVFLARSRPMGRESSLMVQQNKQFLALFLGHARVHPSVCGKAVQRQLFQREMTMTQRMDYNAATPAGMKALGGVYGHVMQCGLPKVLVDLVYLRVSQINGCAYCIDMHSRDLLAEGVKIEKLVLVPAWREAGALFDASERAALAWAESVTLVAAPACRTPTTRPRPPCSTTSSWPT